MVQFRLRYDRSQDGLFLMGFLALFTPVLISAAPLCIEIPKCKTNIEITKTLVKNLP